MNRNTCDHYDLCDLTWGGVGVSDPSRMIRLRLCQSWYGHEDPQLTQKLLEERPGVLLWAVAGLKRLRERGHFVQPLSGVDSLDSMVELSSPVTAFVAECCELGSEWQVERRKLFTAWREWCRQNGQMEGNEATFGRNLKAAFPEIQEMRPRVAGMRSWVHAGIGLPGPLPGPGVPNGVNGADGKGLSSQDEALLRSRSRQRSTLVQDWSRQGV